MLFIIQINDIKAKKRRGKMLLDRNNQKGATMMETLGVLAIFVMMGAAAFGLISNIWGLLKQNMVVNEARDIQKAISDSYKAEGTYKKLFKEEGNEWDAVTNPSAAARPLCAEKIAPYQMCSGGELHHRLSGKVFVSPDDEDVGAEDPKYNKYKLTFMGLSKKACVALTRINWFTQKQSAIYRMSINVTGTGGGTFICLPGDQSAICTDSLNIYNFSLGDAMSACNDSDQQHKNTVDFVFF